MDEEIKMEELVEEKVVYESCTIASKFQWAAGGFVVGLLLAYFIH